MIRKNITVGLLSLLSTVAATSAFTAEAYADGCNYNDDRKNNEYFKIDFADGKIQDIMGEFKPKLFDPLQIDDGDKDEYDDRYDNGYSDGRDDGYNAWYDAQNNNNKKDKSRREDGKYNNNNYQ